MPINDVPPSPSKADIRQLFDSVDDPPPRTFEVALVLGGTVSAGAYTAGALDFLFESLDAWETRREGENYAGPSHRVQIRVIAGTSGGGVNAAIASRALNYAYPPIDISSSTASVNTPPFGSLSGNPFYDVWCRMLHLDGMLDPSDFGKGSVNSVLNGKPIDDAADHIATFTTSQVKARPYLGDPTLNQPLRIILTMTNLHGIPYKTVFDGVAGQTVGETFVDHADYVRFAVQYEGRAIFEPRPDELVLNFDAARMPRSASWGEFSIAARATSAFPLGFPARVVSREMLDYNYRAAVLPAGPDGKSDIRPLTPDWEQLKVNGMLPGAYSFVAVDGGATDNEPIQLARTTLCGLTGRNPRGAATANRCVLLVDPFSGEAGLNPPPGGLVSIATGTLNTLLQQTRYDTSDIIMAADPTVFSRFLVSADRDGLIGSKALATGGLGAFIGFACSDFLRHDYMLGRANCQAMLKTTFAVAVSNPVVAAWWNNATPAQRAEHGIEVGGVPCCRLVPLFDNVAVDERIEAWPVGKLDPKTFRDSIETRWNALIASETPDGWLTSLAAWAASHIFEGKVADYVVSKMTSALTEWNLLAPGP